ncbi:ferrous iron transport protein A [Alkalicella caledoniensis]|uniref:Ferrous iron transport protein A n=1 Tax=Alkalicella caledoniensis TaxID=2731377 RepID=A0A7G9W7B7_ALKCA|nr:FeoA family protein [Alkalicella caledoniensis]QNO14579.1 ferrous iron transport protein A [Alkalicella caledoniensis]
MSSNITNLSNVPVGSYARVVGLKCSGNSRRRMLDLGLITNTTVESLMQSPSGDPTAYTIRGAVIALRSEEAKSIMVEII